MSDFVAIVRMNTLIHNLKYKIMSISVIKQPQALKYCLKTKLMLNNAKQSCKGQLKMTMYIEISAYDKIKNCFT